MGRIHRTKSGENTMKIKEGDLFQLGNHKLICGDSTQPETYKKLIGTQKIDLIITDPPYNVDYASKNKLLNKLGKGNHVQNKIINDVNIDSSFFKSLFHNWKPFLNDYNSIYIFMTDISLPIVVPPFIHEGFIYNNILTWLKNSHVYSYTKIIYGWYGKHKFYGGFNTDVLEYKKPHKSLLHPTMKPLKLIAKLMANSSQSGMNVLDCFGGSGTTLLVCEKLNRNCYMIEKDPHYVEIIIRRWENMTKQKAIKI